MELEDKISRAEVIDTRTLGPLAREARVGSATKTGRVLVLDDGVITGTLSWELTDRPSAD